ncbi:hypothetical protein BDP55DRAFT_677639 [Colletotrichum godetiae]|uniref:F-box domain-containing protein n=1 Tax=Colletotrichum godetiae TaxID=1209918 RepID=A0AAJ0ABF5_9PEZI|nr:uncharacterized protein BDP55DRAFT_677639 [Colletotrichum godetiae]KAK1660054.1 hypothetical protein BDP55DRAFT_677639 [Colletotrichum godetiae]
MRGMVISDSLGRTCVVRADSLLAISRLSSNKIFFNILTTTPPCRFLLKDLDTRSRRISKMGARGLISNMDEKKLEVIKSHTLISPSRSYPTLQRLNHAAYPRQKRCVALKADNSSQVYLQQAICPNHQPASKHKMEKRITRDVEGSHSGLAIIDLPPELHLIILDFLDIVDGTCFGLASRYFYALHRRRHGRVHLDAGRPGPNGQEWAWRLAFPLSRFKPINIAMTTIAESQDETTCTLTYEHPISQPQPNPQPHFSCEKCGRELCELQRHLRKWFPQDHEYCRISGKYVRADSCREKQVFFCHRRSPKNHALCGKHHPR